jgi:hypothetical protein
MSRDGRGRIYVTWQNYGHGPELAAVYDSTGRFIQEIGRKGKGPGEFIYPVTVNVDRRNQLLVWDFDGMRETVFDSSYRFVRQYIQRAATLVILPDGRKVANFSALDARNNPAPVSVYDSLGAVVTAFGATDVAHPGVEPWRANRFVGLGSGNTVWAALPDMYRLERWTLTGHLTNIFTRATEWFAPITKQANLNLGELPTPVTRAVREDPAGRVWFVVSVAAEHWRASLGKPRMVPGRATTYPERNRSASYDTMIDVIDVNTGKLLVSQRVPGMMQFFLADDLISSYRQDADGTPIIEIWRVRLATTAARSGRSR